MNALESLQSWYFAQCNGEWEHTYGVTIGTLDNPGWSLIVDLAETGLQQASFSPISLGVGSNAEPTENDWLVCKVEGSKFLGYGGPAKLEVMITVFLSWAQKNSAHA